MLSRGLARLWAWLMFDEPLSWTMFMGMLVSLLGIIIIARAQATLASSAEAV